MILTELVLQIKRIKYNELKKNDDQLYTKNMTVFDGETKIKTIILIY